MFGALMENPDRNFTLSLVTNMGMNNPKVMLASIAPGQDESVDKNLGLSWPDDIYSLTHVALPFPPDDPLYGGMKGVKSPGIHLGDIALRGERDVLEVSAANMLRLRWNPFYSYVEDKILDFFEL